MEIELPQQSILRFAASNYVLKHGKYHFSKVPTFGRGHILGPKIALLDRFDANFIEKEPIYAKKSLKITQNTSYNHFSDQQISFSPQGGVLDFYFFLKFLQWKLQLF